MATLNLQVGANADDTGVQNGIFNAEAGNHSIGDTGFGSEGHLSVRFTGAAALIGATISSASLEFKATANRSTNSCNLRISGHDVDEAAAPTDGTEFSNATLTTANVDWTAEAFVSGQWHESPDIADVLQEIVDRPGFNGVLQFFVKNNSSSNNANRQVQAHDTAAADAAKLNVDYEAAPAAGHTRMTLTGVG